MLLRRGDILFASPETHYHSKLQWSAEFCIYEKVSRLNKVPRETLVMYMYNYTYLEIFQISEYFGVSCLAKDGRVRPADEYVNAVGKGFNVGTLTGQL